MSRIKQLMKNANRVGLTFDSYNPGAVKTRYRFFNGVETHSYFGGNGIVTLYGLASAETWLQGYAQGIDRKV